MVVSFSRLQKKWAIWDNHKNLIGTYSELEFRGLDATFVIKTNEHLRERQGWIECDGRLETDGDKAVIHGEAQNQVRDDIGECRGHRDRAVAGS